AHGELHAGARAGGRRRGLLRRRGAGRVRAAGPGALVATPRSVGPGSATIPAPAGRARAAGARGQCAARFAIIGRVMDSDLLAGTRVLDFSRYIAGPYCAMLLGFLGADVVR